MSDSHEKFTQIISDFKKDLLIAFPELESKFTATVLEMYNHCYEMYPKLFFQLLYENDTLFETECFLLPNIDFTILMKDQSLSEKSKRTIWKYLQLILFCVVEKLNNSDSFGESSKIFEAVKEEDLHKKIAETMEGMKDFFSDISNSGEASDNFIDPDNLKSHLDGLMNGKIGNLAKEIAEEASATIGDQKEFMETVMKNPTKILSLVKDIGTKLEDKIKKGDVKQSELLEEATEIMDKIKDIPGLKQMMAKMGMSGNFDFKGMANKMEQNMKAAKMKERLQKKREQKAATVTQKDENTFTVKVDDTVQPKSQKPKKVKKNKKKKPII